MPLDSSTALPPSDYRAVVRALSWSWRQAQAQGRPDIARDILAGYLVLADLRDLQDLWDPGELSEGRAP